MYLHIHLVNHVKIVCFGSEVNNLGLPVNHRNFDFYQFWPAVVFRQKLLRYVQNTDIVCKSDVIYFFQ